MYFRQLQKIKKMWYLRWVFLRKWYFSCSEDFQIHLKRSANSCFGNNYFSEKLLEWEANLDIQPVFKQCKAIGCMSAYLSNCEDECFQAMGQAVKGGFEHNLDNYKPVKSVAHTYVNKRECSIQECVYHILAVSRCIKILHVLYLTSWKKTPNVSR